MRAETKAGDVYGRSTRLPDIDSDCPTRSDEKIEGAPIVAYANRLPVARGREGWRPSVGGLVSALRPALEPRDSAWVGWDGGAKDIPPRVEGLDVELLPLALSRRQVEDFHHGFANRTLWPLRHGLIEQPIFERRWWEAYREVNERFAAFDAGGGDCAGCTTTT